MRFTVRNASSSLLAATILLVAAGCADEPTGAGSPRPSASVAAQSSDFVPGTTYYPDANRDIEYIAGNLPVIFTAPHDGDETAGIPARAVGEACGPAITTARDIGTAELVRSIRSAYFAQTGKYPHIVITRLHRTRLDANRDLKEAACGNPRAEKAWRDYHEYIDGAKARIAAEFGKGWYTDIHGHGHDIDQLELGYELTATTLRRTDASLDGSATVEKAASFRVFSEQSSLSFSAMLRGPTSLGTLLTNAGFASVPSQQKPAPPEGEPYFNGGYNTDRHACSNGGQICGLQIETHYAGVRDNATSRTNFARAIVSVYREFLGQFGITIPADVARPGLGEALIVQHDNAANNPTFARFAAGSNWTLGSNGGSFNGVNFRLASANASATNDGAEFFFYIATPGTYSVDAWWSSLSTRTSGASYRVFELDGGTRLDDLKLSQRVNGARWNRLGSYRFSRVGWAKVLMSRSLSTVDGSLSADAIRVIQSNGPPVAAFGAPSAADEGSTVAFDGSTSSDPDGDPLTYAWTFGDGATGTGAAPTHAYANDGTYQVTLTVTDRFGVQSSASASIAVADVAPTIGAFAGGTIRQGDTFTSGGTFTDPGADSWSATVDYGDGSGQQPLALAGKSFALSHRYTRAGTFTVSVVVADGPATGTRTAEVVVQNVVPTVTIASGATLLQGETYTSTASFTDPGADVWRATVDYGAGGGAQPLPPVAPSTSFTLSHRYMGAGSFTVQVAVHDGHDTGTGTARVIVQTPAQAVDVLSDAVTALVNGTTVPAASATSLFAKLEAAAAQISRRNYTAATAQLQAFINEIEALVRSGQIDQRNGTAVIGLARRIVESMATL